MIMVVIFAATDSFRLAGIRWFTAFRTTAVAVIIMIMCVIFMVRVAIRFLITASSTRASFAV